MQSHSVDWAAYAARRVPAPTQPEFASEYDTNNFDKYPDSEEDTAPELPAKERELFREF